MTAAPDLPLARSLLRIRIGQLLVNEELKRKALRVPVHLALGHEAIAAAVAAIMGPADALCLPHRNIHYNLARATSLRTEFQELRLAEDGVAGGWLGSMNMANPECGIAYTSSILGNNLGVAAGIALGDRVRGADSATFVVTGDGAMEEGAFYESLQFSKTYGLPTVMIVENNGWSLATTIEERRCPIDLAALAAAFGVPYLRLSGNDVVAYRDALTALRSRTRAEGTPAIVEVMVTTLGFRRMVTPDLPDGRLINYHHGAVSTVEAGEWPLIAGDDSDPLHVLLRRDGGEGLRALASRVWAEATAEAAVVEGPEGRA